MFEAKVTSKGQMVILKPQRERYNLRNGLRVRVIAMKEGLLIKAGLNGL